MRRRATSFSPPERFLLDCWGDALRAGLGKTAYLVGSVARAEEWRDVDVRVIVDDADPLVADPARLQALNVAFSMWGQRVTGLPIEFQLQSMAEANGGDNPGPRVPLGTWRHS